ncbi:MAG: HAD hydrolase-like protein [Thalassospira sp.]|uniref:HAD family hydrolase n=1 Tax=Thalassospira sp. TaxID=1912094 RepID=UPI001B2AE9D9|nr:HAD family hydrolase [Thalassospira sp.]MBO6578018.1 HAD hydrolase-like protein [Thalassospira sp.]MBO6802606.1 HAD hydrolase-like protein [Thalassospira sp.]MBO6818989.1 HAD hydrolase-like protein [Thalassospira sp.]MBO6889109.1 HAD hydrolase-like protein [Thalassospira sp.]
MYKLIAFDGDDTLWHNEPLFRQAHVQLREMLGHYVDPEQVDDRLYQAELANLSIYGYGVTGFTLSMIETAIELSDRKISAEDIHKLAEIGKSMLRAPTRIIDGAEAVLKQYAKHPNYKVVLITKGDLIAQQLKIDRSGFEDLFDGIEIVSEKDPLTYRNIFGRYGVEPEDAIMIGNSMKSDILPVLACGATAIHIPYEITWVHEMVDQTEIDNDKVITAESIADVPGIIEKLENEKTSGSMEHV